MNAGVASSVGAVPAGAFSAEVADVMQKVDVLVNTRRQEWERQKSGEGNVVILLFQIWVFSAKLA
jgi:hypothetical protein